MGALQDDMAARLRTSRSLGGAASHIDSPSEGSGLTRYFEAEGPSSDRLEPADRAKAMGPTPAQPQLEALRTGIGCLAGYEAHEATRQRGNKAEAV